MSLLDLDDYFNLSGFSNFVFIISEVADQEAARLRTIMGAREIRGKYPVNTVPPLRSRPYGLSRTKPSPIQACHGRSVR